MLDFNSDALTFFNEVKLLYNWNQQDLILYNNKDILIEGKSFYHTEWFHGGFLTVKDLLDDNGYLLSFQDFRQKYLRIVLNQTIMEDLNTADFPLNENTELNLEKIKAKDFYWLFIINSDFHFKFVRRAVVCSKELFRFGIKDDDNCLYCGESDSIENSFIYCHFTRLFIEKVI